MTLSTREKLRIAGYTAPRIRDPVSAKQIKVVDAKGNVVREISTVDLALKVHERAGIEFGTIGGVTPKKAQCATCPSWYTPIRHKPGPLPKQCNFCRSGRGQTECPGYGKGPCKFGINGTPVSPPSKNAFNIRRMLARHGEPWRCNRCALKLQASSIRRSEAARQRHARWAPERRSEIARQRAAIVGKERKSEISRKAAAAKTPEQRSAIVRKGWTKRERATVTK
jgi:hypothetical protein